jgi:pyruvate dehydrogenase E2 component (dihydrolipoamide acetyltransferase)
MMVMKEIRFVDVGEGITEGHIQKWLVKDGDMVKEDAPIFQIETDKAIVNIPAPIDGYVKIVAKEDSIVHLGDLVALVGTKDEISKGQQLQPSQTASQKKPQQAQQQQATTKSDTKEIIATPYVRKLAKDLSIDISTVAGTGPNGRILENDVRNIGAKTAPVQKPVPKYSETLEEQHKSDIERIPMSQTRKAIARNMEASWTIPRATHMDLINATRLFNIVAKEKQVLAKDMNIHLTFLPFIIKATIAAIRENPNFNASYDHEKLEIIRKNYFNIGIAAEAPEGLKVIVVKNADRKTIAEMAKEIQNMSEKVKNKTITLEEMQDSTFTITNIGSLGGGFLAVPMINYPNVAILGVTKIRDMPIVENGQIKIGKVLPFSLVFDHRVVDGAEAVKFGNTLIKYLEDPDLLEML